ncbi:OPT family oligopeptide transporter [Limnoglobus roseus]|uniref:Peptide transporter n=1 Tax=Limnoglobus roseus TaxID=2598579 RepID=A0A5C1AAN7_9BACT|nr:oligopeptide transporter, OPT family [Limnoglobus roseus]QEL16281.1 peptide transporter [Limnoglobus roseus]
MPPPSDPPADFRPFVPATETPKEFTLTPIIVGTLLGIVFGASSVYLVLKVGMTVSASIPVAVLSITVFKALSKAFKLRTSTILENNIAQTAGSAGESIAFAVGLVMPALLVLGFDIDVIRVMTVGVLGGLLGILMMIPLRRAFVVKKHGELKYPEGTACADVLIAGEKGGSTARMLFLGFGLAFAYQWLMKACKLWKDEAEQELYDPKTGDGLNGAAIGSEMNPSLLGVGYIIGPRIASIMVAGGVLAYLVFVPTIKYFGANLDQPLAPAVSKIDDKTGKDVGLIKNMSSGQVRNAYILYIGAGAVAAGGIISMVKALPVIFGSVVAGFRDMRGGVGVPTAGLRTDRDLPMSVVLFGSLGLVVALAVAPSLGLGLNVTGIAGAFLILLFGFLFVTVSSRLTGEIGSSSNPISGMTVATLLLTCLILLGLNEFGVIGLGKGTKLLALTIAGVVCVACSNGGTTSQALKTGHLVGATPIWQQYAILIGSLTSAVAIGFVLLLLNQAGTVYTKKNLPPVTVEVTKLTAKDTVRVGQYADDKAEYFVLVVGKREKVDPTLIVGGEAEAAKVTHGRFLVDAAGKIVYRCDPAVNGDLKEQDNGEKVENKFDAPKTELIALIIDGILDRNLPWNLVILGVLIAITLELSGVPSLPFAVGVYLPLSASVPVFVGGMVRWAADQLRRNRDEGDSSPGVLLGSGYIAGAAIAQVIVAFLEFWPSIPKALDLSGKFEHVKIGDVPWNDSNVPTVALFGLLAVVLFAVGTERLGKKAK